MNITNIQLKEQWVGFERWQYELDGVLHHYTTMKDIKVIVISCIEPYNKLIVIKGFIGLDVNNPKHGIEQAYKIGMLQ
jgi:hypothetical protein